MVKRIIKARKKAKGEGRAPLLRRGLALFLSFLFVFFIFPCSVSCGESWDIPNYTIMAWFNSSSSISGSYKPGQSIPNGGRQQTDLYQVVYNLEFNMPLKRDDNINLQLTNIASPDWYKSMETYAIFYFPTTTIRVYGTYSDGVSSFSFSSPDDCSTYSCDIYQLNFTYRDYNFDHPNAWLGLKSISFKAESETSGLLNSILEWLRSIRDKIVNLPSEIGQFINNLKSSIGEWFNNVGDWFSELGENIKQRFIEVGEWFSSLGDRIGEFFTNLFERIKEFFTSLFKPSDDYFDNLRLDLDSFLTEHLGAVYELPSVLLSNLREVVSIVKTGNRTPSIFVPEISFSIRGKEYVILESRTWNLLEAFDHSEDGGHLNDALNLIYNLALNFIDIMLAVFCFRMIYRKIINKVGVEGGDEL